MKAENISVLQSQSGAETAIIETAPCSFSEDQIIVADVISLARKNLWMAPTTAVAAALLAWLVSAIMTPIYESSAMVQIGTVFRPGYGVVPIESVDQVKKRIEFKSSLEVASNGGRVFILRVRDPSPGKALESANRVITEMLVMHESLSNKSRSATQRRVNDLRKLSASIMDLPAQRNILAQISELDGALAMEEPTYLITSPALELIRPHMRRNIILGFAIGLIEGLLAIFLYSYVKWRSARQTY